MLVGSKTAAAVIGVTEPALHYWRKAGIGPKWHDEPGHKGGGGGRKVFYDAREVQDFAFARRAQPLLDRLEALEARAGG